MIIFYKKTGSKSTKVLANTDSTCDEPDKPKTLKVKQTKVKSAKNFVEKKVKKTEKDLVELNQQTKKLFWDEEREVLLFFFFKFIRNTNFLFIFFNFLL